MCLTAFSKNKWTTLLLFLAAGCSTVTKERALPYFNTPDFTPLFLSSPAEKNTRITHAIASFSLEDQDGNRIGNATVKGKIHVANFIFTSCGSICPKMTDGMNK